MKQKELGKNEYKSYILVDFDNISKKIIDIFENEYLSTENKCWLLETKVI